MYNHTVNSNNKRIPLTDKIILTQQWSPVWNRINIEAECIRQSYRNLALLKFAGKVVLLRWAEVDRCGGEWDSHRNADSGRKPLFCCFLWPGVKTLITCRTNKWVWYSTCLAIGKCLFFSRVELKSISEKPKSSMTRILLCSSTHLDTDVTLHSVYSLWNGTAKKWRWFTVATYDCGKKKKKKNVKCGTILGKKPMVCVKSLILEHWLASAQNSRLALGNQDCHHE